MSKTTISTYKFKVPYSTTTSTMQTYYYDINATDEWISYDYALTPTSSLDKAKYALQAEERLEAWISDNFDKYDIQEYGSYIYDSIQEQAYEVVSNIVSSFEETWGILLEDDEDTVVEAIVQEIDFNALYDVVSDIIDAPSTIEEKMADIGMSYRDFL